MMKQKKFNLIDLTNDEIRASRYMTGGRAGKFPDKIIEGLQLISERPGALMDFLNCFYIKWNISLFHYKIRDLFMEELW